MEGTARENCQRRDSGTTNLFSECRKYVHAMQVDKGGRKVVRTADVTEGHWPVMWKKEDNNRGERKSYEVGPQLPHHRSDRGCTRTLVSGKCGSHQVCAFLPPLLSFWWPRSNDLEHKVAVHCSWGNGPRGSLHKGTTD